MPQTLKAELRDQIMKSATSHFTARGLQQTTMRMISKDAGTSPGNLYRYVPSKQALYEELTSRTYDRLSQLADRLERVSAGRGHLALDEFDNFLKIRAEDPTGLAILFANRGEEPMQVLIARFEGLLSVQLTRALAQEGREDAPILGLAMARGILAALFQLLMQDPDASPESLRTLVERLLSGTLSLGVRGGDGR